MDWWRCGGALFADGAEVARRLAAGSIPGVGWTCLSGLMMRGQQVGHGHFESADKRCTARIAGIAFRRTLEVKPLQSQGPPCQGQVLMGTG